MAHKTDNPANKWHKQRQKQREHGRAVDERRNGEVMNADE